MDEDVRDLVKQAARLFREYEAHHTAKLSEGPIRATRAARNREMAEKLEALLAGAPK